MRPEGTEPPWRGGEARAEGIDVWGRVADVKDHEAVTKVMSEELAPSCDGFPVPRPADPTELTDLVAFLCSRRAGYLTGLTVPFDGAAPRRVV